MRNIFVQKSCKKWERETSSCPADTGRKLNVHKTFRGRPGRLLNVLCTFNLRPVSMRWSLPAFYKSFEKSKSKWLTPQFQYILIVLNMDTQEKQTVQKFRSKDILKFDLSEKSLKLVSTPHFVYNFPWKSFPMLHSINWRNVIFWLPLFIWYIEQYLYCNYLLPSWWQHKF